MKKQVSLLSLTVFLLTSSLTFSEPGKKTPKIILEVDAAESLIEDPRTQNSKETTDPSENCSGKLARWLKGGLLWGAFSAGLMASQFTPEYKDPESLTKESAEIREGPSAKKISEERKRSRSETIP